MKFKFLGIEIERKTDVLAFAAFVISLGGLITQMVNLFKGSEIIVENLEQVSFYMKEYSAGDSYLNLISEMTYYNSGSPGYSDVVRSELITVNFGADYIQLKGFAHVHSQENEQDPSLLDVKNPSFDIAAQVKARDAESHETRFVPFNHLGVESSGSFIKQDALLSKLEQVDEIKVLVETTFFSGKATTAECRIDSQQIIDHFNDKGWSAAECL